MSRAERLLAVLVLAVIGAFILGFRAADSQDFRAFFAWPTGGVWSNIVSSVILGGPALYAILRRLAKQHREHLSLLQAHHEEHLATLEDHHQQVLDAVKTAQPPTP